MNLPSKYHYFDYAAGWPVTPRALEVYVRVAGEVGNPGSVHRAGQRALGVLDRARDEIAAAVQVDRSNVIFVSSATEANNLALQGSIAAFRKIYPNNTPEVIISALEHDSIRVPLEVAAAQGEIVLKVIPVSAEQGFDLESLQAALSEYTAVISVMQVSNETGTLLPLDKIAQQIQIYRKEKHWPVFHVDAAQAPAYVDELATTHADLVTYAGYKVGSVAGCGMLIVRNRELLEAQIFGGGQEKGIRAGTENVAAIASCAQALTDARAACVKNFDHAQQVRGRIVKHIYDEAPQVEINGGDLPAAPHIINLWIPGKHAQETLAKLDLAGFAVAAGPACSARSLEPSRVLQAMGYSRERASESIRISFGPETTIEEVEALLRELY